MDLFLIASDCGCKCFYYFHSPVELGSRCEPHDSVAGLRTSRCAGHANGKVYIIMNSNVLLPFPRQIYQHHIHWESVSAPVADSCSPTASPTSCVSCVSCVYFAATGARIAARTRRLVLWLHIGQGWKCVHILVQRLHCAVSLCSILL